MYNPGSIADRLRELQSEVTLSHAHLNFLNDVLAKLQNEAKSLREENSQLKEKISSLEDNSQPSCSGTCHRPRPTAMEVLSNNVVEDTNNDNGRTKQAKRNSPKV
jgi:uncharacterized coiled-coil protein SlyX